MSLLEDKIKELRHEVASLDVSSFQRDQGENSNKQPLVYFSFVYTTKKSNNELLIALKAGEQKLSMENIHLRSLDTTGKRSRKNIFSLIDYKERGTTLFGRNDITILNHGLHGDIYPQEGMSKSLYYKSRTESFVLHSIDRLLKLLPSQQ